MQANFNYDISMKIVVCGDSGVGKTSLLRKWEKSSTTDNTSPTLAVDMILRTITRDEKKIVVNCWDTAGQERYRAVTPLYFKNSHAILIMFDITNTNSFRSVRQWLDDVKMYSSESDFAKQSVSETAAPYPYIVLVGCKNDMYRMVSKFEISYFCEQHKLAYFETSSKSGEGIAELFDHVVETLYKHKVYNANGSSTLACFEEPKKRKRTLSKLSFKQSKQKLFKRAANEQDFIQNISNLDPVEHEATEETRKKMKQCAIL